MGDTVVCERGVSKKLCACVRDGVVCETDVCVCVGNCVCVCACA